MLNVGNGSGVDPAVLSQTDECFMKTLPLRKDFMALSSLSFNLHISKGF